MRRGAVKDRPPVFVEGGRSVSSGSGGDCRARRLAGGGGGGGQVFLT